METSQTPRDNAHTEAFQHLRGRLRSCDVSTAPSPHAYITNAFPQSYYDDLLAYLPGPEAYVPIPSATAYSSSVFDRLGKNATRRHLWLANFLNHSLPSSSSGQEQALFWLAVARSFSSQEFITAVSSVFSATVGTRPLVAAPRLVREDAAVYVPPHLDDVHKPFTLLFYLKHPAAADAPGTSLYSAVDGAPVCSFPYEANALLLLHRTPDALHGIEPHLLNGFRDTLYVYIQDATRRSKVAILA